MLFALICRDKPGALEIRKANREAHLAYAREHGGVVFGGPMLDEDGAMIGSLLALEAEDRAGAEAFAANDPYARAGLFQSVEITGFRKVFG
jgi:uncharacterized protein YciI